MTNKQTIDGVSRELLERIAAEPRDIDAQVRRQAAVDELRALLDKPAQDTDGLTAWQKGRDAMRVERDYWIEKCTTIGMPVYQTMSLTDGQGWHDVTLDRYQVAKSAPEFNKVRILYDSPAAQPQGEVERLRKNLIETESRLDLQRQYNTQRHVELSMESMQVMGKNTRLRAKLAERDALLLMARQFVVNGIEFGYIRMPETDTPDPAHDLLPKIDAALSTSAEPKPAQPYPNRICHVDYTAHPHLCGCKDGDEEAQRMYDERYGKASAEPKPRGGVNGNSREPKPRGEPVAKAKPVAKLHAERLTGRDGEYGITVEDSQWFNTCRLTGGVFNLYAEPPAPCSLLKEIIKGWEESAYGDPPVNMAQAIKAVREYLAKPEQPAPLADEAAKAFAKGFNTLESGSGKYRINMQFQSREDAWGAFNVLARLKQLNTPQ